MRNQHFYLLFIFVLFMSACAPAQTPTTAAPTTAIPVGTAVMATGTTASAKIPTSAQGYAGPTLTDQPITIKVLRFQASPAMESVLATEYKEFTAVYPNIQFVDEVVPFGQLADKIQATVATDTGVDIIFYDGPYTKSYAYNSVLLPLDKYMTDAFKQDYLASTLAEHSYKSQVYGMPQQQSSVALVYNKDMTDAAGITPPTDLKDAWTWDQALAAFQKCQKVSSSGQVTVWGLAPSQFGGGGAGFYYRDGIFSRSAGDPKAPTDSTAYKTFAALSADGTQTKGYIDTPEAIQAMTWFQKLFTVWKVTPQVGIPNSFLDKKACFNIDTDSFVSTVAQTYPDGSFHYGFTPIPYFKTPIIMTGSVTEGVSAKSKHPAEAAAFLIWIDSTQNALRYWQLTKNMPALQSVFNLIPEYNTFPLKIYKDELVNIGVPRPSTPGWAEYEAIIDPAINNISLGADVASTLHTAADQIDAQLQKYK
jgi:fructooligosaccharide transport system substrate-binding protein